MWVGDHIDHLKTELVAMNYGALPIHCIDVLSEVIDLEVVGGLIASNLGIQYDEALNVSRDEKARNGDERADMLAGQAAEKSAWSPTASLAYLKLRISENSE